MQKYKSHKVVEAAQISGFENMRHNQRGVWVGPDHKWMRVPEDFFARGQPSLGDYLVKYEGGYLSWSPKDVFEAGYAPVVETGITVTVEVPGEHSYRKKPVVVQAFQMTRERRASNAEWPAWMHEAWNKDVDEPGSLHPVNADCDGTGPLAIFTLEGLHYVNWGDYIIQGVKGELYSCKADIFKATYDQLCRDTQIKKPLSYHADSASNDRDKWS